MLITIEWLTRHLPFALPWADYPSHALPYLLIYANQGGMESPWVSRLPTIAETEGI